MESVVIIIPNYNGMQHLEMCLRSLKYQLFNNYKIIVVDNGSTDNSIKYINDNFYEIDIIPLKTNKGFSVAVNIGIKRTLEVYCPDYILLLNNDIECEKDFLTELLKGFNDSNVGSATPKMLNYYRRDILDDTGNFISKKYMPYPRGQGQKDLNQYKSNDFVFGACAGAAMYKSEVFLKVGLFDEDYFAYYEDIDLSFRLQTAGFECKYVPDSVCYHKRGGTMSSKPNFHIYLIERNLVLLRLKTYPIEILALYSLYYTVSRIIRFIRYFINVSPSYSFSAIKGYFIALCMIPKTLFKRRKLWKSKKVSRKYIKNLFR